MREEEGSALRGLNSVREFSGIILAVSRRLLPVKTSVPVGFPVNKFAAGQINSFANQLFPPVFHADFAEYFSTLHLLKLLS